jgi:hypothetical protein
MASHDTGFDGKEIGVADTGFFPERGGRAGIAIDVPGLWGRDGAPEEGW